MHIIIPMSGFGERFRKRGYKVPKPLIEVEGRPIISHVLDLFPGELKVTFVCNSEHLACSDYALERTLQELCPSAHISAIAPHRLGPVYAVSQVFDRISPTEQVVVNYCDFTCYWDYSDFKSFLQETDSDGCVPSYRGFHPHMLGPNNYAFIRDENRWLVDIREKEPFTEKRMQEFASSGTYYFKTGALLKHYFQRALEAKLQTNNEYYVSLVYRLMAQDGLRVSVYELEHFMQWGTPEDLDEYNYWSAAFRRLATEPRRHLATHAGSLVMPMAGAGSRFSQEGYTTPKPLIEVSGEPMVVQASEDLPRMKEQTFVLRSDLPGFQSISAELMRRYAHATLLPLNGLTDGQARTCLLGVERCNPDEPLIIGACDAGLLYNQAEFESLIADPKVDVIVWGVRGYPSAARKPQMYGWLDMDDDEIRAASVKKALAHPEHDPVIVGSFAFRRAGDFVRCVERLIARNERVNGELYVDSCINDAIALGLNCRLLQCSHYLSWGTPQELNTFEYWQSCFSKWEAHPYSLQSDSRVSASKRETLAKRFQSWATARPGMQTPAKSNSPVECASKTLQFGKAP